MHNPRTLVLGSTSPYRAALLEKLGLPFLTDAPEIDEQAETDETPADLVTRLAEAKARAVGERHPDALVIGSDQVACIGERILGKPGNRENAIMQLSAASGKAVVFYTGLCLLDTKSGRAGTLCEPYRVHFRHLSPGQVERYVDAEQPFDCAGSFRSEGLGISLFERLEGNDPNALVGLPLIRLIDLLRERGVEVP
jgi:MAF protein